MAVVNAVVGLSLGALIVLVPLYLGLGVLERRRAGAS